MAGEYLDGVRRPQSNAPARELERRPPLEGLEAPRGDDERRIPGNLQDAVPRKRGRRDPLHGKSPAIVERSGEPPELRVREHGGDGHVRGLIQHRFLDGDREALDGLTVPRPGREIDDDLRGPLAVGRQGAAGGGECRVALLRVRAEDVQEDRAAPTITEEEPDALRAVVDAPAQARLHVVERELLSPTLDPASMPFGRDLTLLPVLEQFPQQRPERHISSDRRV